MWKLSIFICWQPVQIALKYYNGQQDDGSEKKTNLMNLAWPSVIIWPRTKTSYGKIDAQRKETLPNHEVSLGWTGLKTQVPGFPGRSFPHKANRGSFFVSHLVLHVLVADWPNIHDLCMKALALGQVQASVTCPMLCRICMHPTLIFIITPIGIPVLITKFVPSSILGALLTS